MRKNELALAGKVDKFKHIFDNLGPLESEIKSISDDEQHAQILQQTSGSLAEFFGIQGDFSIEEFTTSFVDNASEELKEKFESSITKEENLSARTEEENEKRYKDSQFIFQRRIAESKELTEPDWSKSTDYVISQSTPGYAEKLGHSSYKQLNQMNQSKPVTSGFGRPAQPQTKGSTYATGSAQSNSTQTNEQTGPVDAMDAFGSMNAEIQKLGRQKIKGWNEKSEDEIGYFEAFARNTPWWKKSLRKAKLFIKGKKGKITLKVAMLLGLNMGMAVFSKRYEFENGKQMTAMFAFMMTSFFLTRELSEEGVDLGGFGF